MDPKKWKKEMSEKFMTWRENNNKSGIISVPEVIEWTMDVINETTEINKRKRH